MQISDDPRDPRTEQNNVPYWKVSWDMDARPGKRTGNSYSREETAVETFKRKQIAGLNPIILRGWCAGWAF